MIFGEIHWCRQHCPHIADEVIRNGHFASREELGDRLKRFIAYFNSTMANPMNWTYTGRPPNSPPTPRPRFWRERRRLEPVCKEQAAVRMNW
jgi:hypothetical protein